MIKLNVPEYCQECTDFEPQVTQRPDQAYTSHGELSRYVFGDTIVECEYRDRCEAIYNYLKKEEKL